MHASASFSSTVSSIVSWEEDTRPILLPTRIAVPAGYGSGRPRPLSPSWPLSLNSPGSASSPASPTSDASLIDDAFDGLGPRGADDTVVLVRQLLRGVDLRVLRGTPGDAADRFVRDGEWRHLPQALRGPAAQALVEERDPHCPSGRLRAFVAAIGRAARNLAHCGARNFASVALPTMVRQAIGRALDVALAESVSETARTWLSCGALAVPVVGQAVLMIRDEARGEATRYSRATRVALMALPAGAGVLGATTGTML